jgi:hypothetical protein
LRAASDGRFFYTDCQWSVVSCPLLLLRRMSGN